MVAGRVASDASSMDETAGSNVRVVVRVRPENKTEREGNHNNVIRVLDDNLLVFDPREEESVSFYQGRKRRGRDLLVRKKKDIRFAFDQVFDMECNNEEVHQKTTQGILDGLLDGYNCSVFAYGATGAGKTFTMLGSKDSPGVVFHTMMELYQRIEQVKADKTCDVAVSYLEVYNEQIRDLLNPGDFLPIREDPQKGVIVARLSLHKPNSAEELLHMLAFGNQNRTQHPTDANAESSRSHAVFQVYVRQQERTANISADVRVAKMSLIDLAGSERATVTKNRGARFREGANINRSLLALGNCINALADAKYKGHVPYRNSKLTRLLKDSLGGNCRTVMIAAVSPSAASYEDTHNTLKYANRAKNIKANLKRNVMSVDFHVTRYAKIVEELRAEVSELKDKLKKQAVTPSAAMVVNNATRPVMERSQPQQPMEVQRLQECMSSIFSERRSIHKELMELEGSERDLTYKIYRKQRALARITAIDNNNSDMVASRLERAVVAATKRQKTLKKRMKELQDRLQICEETVKKQQQKHQHSQELLSVLRCEGLEVETMDTRRQLRCVRKLARMQHRDSLHTHRLVCMLLSAYKHQYFLLKGNTLTTKDMDQQYTTVLSLAEGEAEVAWADQSAMEDKENCSQEPNGGGPYMDIEQLISFPVIGDRTNSIPATPSTVYKHNPKVRTKATPRRPLQQPEKPKSCLKFTQKMPPTPDHPPVFSPAVPPAKSLFINPANVTHTREPPCSNDTVIIAPCQQLVGTCMAPSSPRSIHVSSVSSVMVSEPGSPGNATFTLDGVAPMANSPHIQEDNKRQPMATADQNNLTYHVNDNNLTVNRAQTKQSQHERKHEGEHEGEHEREHEGEHGQEKSQTERNNTTVTKHKHTMVHAQAAIVNNALTSLDNGDATFCISSEILRNVCQANSKGGTEGGGRFSICSDTVVKKAPVIAAKPASIAKRSIDFDAENLPSPAGKLTFAEAVRSPIAVPARFLAPDVVRSPLASRENLPQLTTNNRLNTAGGRKGVSPLQINKLPATTSSSRHDQNQVVASLHRMGLPSVVFDRHKYVEQQKQQQQQHHSRSNTTGQQNKPSYMQLTQAAVNRQTSTKRKLIRVASFDQIDQPRGGRGPTPPSTGQQQQQPQPGKKMRWERSQSAASLVRRTIKTNFL